MACAHAYAPQSKGIDWSVGHAEPSAEHTAGPAPVLGPVQRARAHCAPVNALMHDPAPLQVRVQGIAEHCIFGSRPIGTGTHTPGAKGIVHDSQVPSQARSQQTPSTQKPDAHSEAVVHAP